MRRLIFFIVLCFSLSGLVLGQLDGLRQKVSNASTQIDLVDALNSLAHFRLKYNFTESDSLARKALTIAESEGYQSGIGKAHLVLGWNNWQYAHYDLALVHLDESIAIFSQLGEEHNLAHAYRIRGLLHHYLVQTDSADLFEITHDSANWSLATSELSFPYAHTFDMDKANELAVEAYKIKITTESIGIQYNTWLFSDRTNQAYQNEAIISSIIPTVEGELLSAIDSGDPYKIAKKNSEIAGLFEMIENNDSALFYRLNAIEIYESLNERNRLGFELMDVGLYRQIDGNLQQAESDFKRALALLSAEKSHHGIGVAVDYLGKLLMAQERFDEARKYFESGFVLSDTLGHKIDMIRFLRRLSDVYRNAGNYDASIDNALRSYNMSLEVTSPNHIMWGAEKLMMAYELKGDYEEAFKYQTIFNDYQLKRVKAMANRQNLEFQSRYELNEKTKTIELLNRENENKEIRISLQRTYLFATIAGVFIVLLFAITLRNRVTKIQLLNRQISDTNHLLQERNNDKEVLLKEIHHRVKNNLQMISSLMGMQKRRLNEKNHKKIFSDAQIRLKSISLIHEHLYQRDSLATISLKSYLSDLIESIIESYKTMKVPKLEMNICECDVDIDTAIPIGLIVNELLINSFKHAFIHQDDPKLNISLVEDRNNYKLIVHDNGPGVKSFSDGFGWVVIKSMIESLDGEYNLDSTEGFSVIIKFVI